MYISVIYINTQMPLSITADACQMASHSFIVWQPVFMDSWSEHESHIKYQYIPLYGNELTRRSRKGHTVMFNNFVVSYSSLNRIERVIISKWSRTLILVQVTVYCRLWIPWWPSKALTQRPPFLNVVVQKDHRSTLVRNGQVFMGPWNIRFNFMVSKLFGRRRE